MAQKVALHHSSRSDGDGFTSIESSITNSQAALSGGQSIEFFGEGGLLLGGGGIHHLYGYYKPLPYQPCHTT